MPQHRIFWTTTERTRVVHWCAEKYIERELIINWAAERVYGLSGLIAEAQDAVLDKLRVRKHIGPLVTELKNAIRDRVAELKNGGARENDARISPATLEPELPNRLGLDPRVADSLAYLFQTGVKTFAEELSKAMSTQIREALYEMRLHLIRPAALAPQAPAPEPYKAVSALPEKFRKPKVAILTLLADQQQIIMRQFPEMDFRFIDRHSKQMKEISKNCERTFIMTKFIGHKHQSEIKGPYSMVNGGMTDLARVIRFNYPNTRYTGSLEVVERVA